MISEFFIRRPVFASVISIVLVLMGLVAYTTLPVAQYPELAPPIVRVEAQYPGANAQTIADTVAAPLEQEVNGVDNMIYMASTSSDGRYQLDVSFEVGTDIDLAAVLVQNRVNIAEPRLPEDARRLGITTRKQSTTLAGVISISSPKGSRDDLYLANYLSIRWRDEFARVPGVGAINVFPSKDYAMRLWLDPAKLKARSLTVNDVVDAVRAQNVQVAAGALGRPPAPTGTDFEYVVNTKGRLSDPAEFAQIIVKAGSGTAGAGTTGAGVVRVGDVARVEIGARDYGTISLFNGKASAILVVYQLPGANLVDLTDRLNVKLAQLAKDLPDDVEAKFFYDSSMFIKASMEEVIKTLVEAFALVFVVVLIFLQSLRTTLIPAITIPVSLIGTFMLMLLFGFSINMLTMFGLVLAIGIVVDDAIIVVENVERNITEHHLPAREATLRAMREITGPVIAITLVLMSVFVPTAFLPGITGQMYRQFALTIAASTALSAVCALTLAPALCAIFLTSGGGHAHGGAAGGKAKGFILLRPLSWLARGFNRVFDLLTAAYAFVVRMSCRAAPLTLLVLFAILAVSFWMFSRVPTGFVPEEDLGFVIVESQLPDGASLERTHAVVRKVGELVGEVDGVRNVVTLTGFSVISGQGSNNGVGWIVLDEWSERYRGGRARDIASIMNDIRGKLAPIEEANFLVFSLPAINGLGNASGFDMRIQDRATVGRGVVQQSVDSMIGAAMGQPGVLAAYSGYRAGVPQLYVDIDREKAIKLDVPLQTVFDALQAFLGSTYVNDYNEFNRTFQVTVQADSPYRLFPEQIGLLEVRTRSGRMVPLATLASVNEVIGPARVERYNLYPSATLNGIPAPGASSGQILKLMEQVAGQTLARGVSFEWTAMSFQERRLGNQALLAMGLAVLLVYLILAAQYESWTVPLAVVISVPLVVLGAVMALNARGLDNNVFTQIGLVLLVGLGAKNAILIVEFARENRAKGTPIVEAAVTAARTRFRPILMTSLAFILGVVPLLFAAGAGAASRRALGTAVFGGMIGNTVLGLLFTPAAYVVVQWSSERVARLFGRSKRAENAVASSGGVIPTAMTAGTHP